ncbi:glutathione S-transferase family protein [Falsiroseomonas sp. HW251]|uniref:glutathione S-transferase family protein n=1 Tax=Falsiroseomonas sp. HW251 TaxID=3390998 RepID=UPI003D31CE6B
MALTLYAHPFSSYSMKVLLALRESATRFDYRSFADDPGAWAECQALWPFGRFPVLVDEGKVVAESSVIIEHLDLHHPGPVRLVPADPVAALEVRFLDRFFDNHVQTPMQAPVFETRRGDAARVEMVWAESRAALDRAYAWLEGRMAGREWACGDGFTMADCAAAPALFYADWIQPIADAFPNVRAYRARLLARPAMAQLIEEARPFRPLFPLGAPDRD